MRRDLEYGLKSLRLSTHGYLTFFGRKKKSRAVGTIRGFCIDFSSKRANAIPLFHLTNTHGTRAFSPAFVYLYNALQVGNAAWTQFLSSTLEFSTEQINGILIAAEVLLFAGVISYKQIMRNWSWRLVGFLTFLSNALACVCIKSRFCVRFDCLKSIVLISASPPMFHAPMETFEPRGAVVTT